jgi:hypothetical protein
MHCLALKVLEPGDKVSVNFVRWIFSPRSHDDWKSWNALIIAAPLAFGLVIVLFDSHRDHLIAARQQSTIGVVTAYEPSNHNQCSYTFEFQGKQYRGESSSPTATTSIGQQVQVYFDRSDPATNSLTDFESESRNNEGFSRFLIIGIFGVIAFILYSKRRSLRH